MSSGASSLIVPLHSAVTFEPVGLVTNVFFDDRNCQVHTRMSSLAYIIRYYPIFIIVLFTVESNGTV